MGPSWVRFLNQNGAKMSAKTAAKKAQKPRQKSGKNVRNLASKTVRKNVQKRATKMGPVIEFSKKATDMKIAGQNFLRPKLDRKNTQKRQKKRAKTRTKNNTKVAEVQHDFRFKKAFKNASGFGAQVRLWWLSCVATVWLLHGPCAGCRPALLHWAVQVGRLSGSVFLSLSFS